MQGVMPFASFLAWSGDTLKVAFWSSCRKLHQGLLVLSWGPIDASRWQMPTRRRDGNQHGQGESRVQASKRVPSFDPQPNLLAHLERERTRIMFANSSRCSIDLAWGAGTDLAVVLRC